MDKKDYDLVVIGGGPAGYAGAIRAGQLGKQVACIEYERAGGTCLNWGCIPSKSLLHAAELYEAFQHADALGLQCSGVGFDFAKVMQRSRQVADKMGGGIEFLFRKNKVDYFLGRGRIQEPRRVDIVAGRDAGQTLKARHILIATGCQARTLPGIEVDGKRVLTARETLALQTMPQSLTILGAGAIGVEFAYFFNAFGCSVTLVERQPNIVPQEDSEVSRTLESALKKKGITLYTQTTAENIRVGNDSVALDLLQDKCRTACESASLLLAVGVVANTQDLFANRVQPTQERGYLKVDDQYQTDIPGIYAAGDIIGPPWLAHVATFEAIQAVNSLFGEGKSERINLNQFPACTYCQPQIGSIGITEAAAKEQGLSYRIGKFPFQASGKAVAINHPEGFAKVIVDDATGELLGAHIIGAEATELIQEYNLAMRNELTIEEIHATIHPHPTLSEGLAEAVAAVSGKAIHI